MVQACQPQLASHFPPVPSLSEGFLRTQSPWIPFLWFLVRGGSIRYTRTAELPLFLLWSFTSSMSGKEFMAQRKLAFHVLGSGSFSPALYRPSGQESEEDRQGHRWGSLAASWPGRWKAKVFLSSRAARDPHWSNQQVFLGDRQSISPGPWDFSMPKLNSNPSIQQASLKGPGGSTRGPIYPKVLFVLDHAQSPCLGC